MNYLQIWIGRKPKKRLMKCINSVLKQVKKNDTYTLISTTNFLKDSNINWIPYKDYLKELKKDKNIKTFLEIIDKANYEIVNATKSDIIRFHFASLNKDVFYLDTDVILKSVPEFNNSIYFAPNKNRRTTIDSHIFYNGSDIDTPKIILKEIINIALYNFKEEKLITSLNMKPWAFRFFNSAKIRKKIKRIDTKYFNHLEDSAKLVFKRI